VLHNKRCVLNKAKMLVNHDNPGILGRAHLALAEAKEAAQRSFQKIRGLCRKLDFQPTVSAAGSIMGKQEEQTNGRPE
jgi:hypothetical protein